MNIYAITLGVNLVDVLIVIAFICAFRLSKKDGIVAELFKLFGVFCTVFITLHYYVRLADFFRAHFIAKDAVTEIFTFCLLSILLFLTFMVIAKGWEMILKMKSFDALDRWGHLIFSLVRSWLICSMILLGVLASNSQFMVGQAKKSLSWYVFRKPAVALYGATYNAVVVKFFPGELINKKVFHLIQETEPRKDG